MKKLGIFTICALTALSLVACKKKTTTNKATTAGNTTTNKVTTTNKGTTTNKVTTNKVTTEAKHEHTFNNVGQCNSCDFTLVEKMSQEYYYQYKVTDNKVYLEINTICPATLYLDAAEAQNFTSPMSDDEVSVIKTIEIYKSDDLNHNLAGDSTLGITKFKDDDGTDYAYWAYKTVNEMAADSKYYVVITLQDYNKNTIPLYVAGEYNHDYGVDGKCQDCGHDICVDVTEEYDEINGLIKELDIYEARDKRVAVISFTTGDESYGMSIDTTPTVYYPSAVIAEDALDPICNTKLVYGFDLSDAYVDAGINHIFDDDGSDFAYWIRFTTYSLIPNTKYYLLLDIDEAYTADTLTIQFFM